MMMIVIATFVIATVTRIKIDGTEGGGVERRNSRGYCEGAPRLLFIIMDG